MTLVSAGIVIFRLFLVPHLRVDFDSGGAQPAGPQGRGSGPACRAVTARGAGVA